MVHSSPKVTEYIRSLPRRGSPRKSPLTKYRRLRNRSPLKPTLQRQAAKRVRLDFSDVCESETPEVQQEAPSSVSATEQPIRPPLASTDNPQVSASPGTVRQQSLPVNPPANQLSSLSPLSAASNAPAQLKQSTPSQSTSPTVMSIMQVHSSKTPEVVQLSRVTSPSKKQKFHVVTVPKNSLKGCGSFGSLALPNLFSAASESVGHKQKSGESSSASGSSKSQPASGASRADVRKPVMEAPKKQTEDAPAKSPSRIVLDTCSLATLSPIRSPVASVRPATSVSLPTSAATSVNYSVPSHQADRAGTAVREPAHGSLHTLLASVNAASQNLAKSTVASPAVHHTSLPGKQRTRVAPRASVLGPQHPPPTLSQSQNAKPV